MSSSYERHQTLYPSNSENESGKSLMKQEHCLLCFRDIEDGLSLREWIEQDALLCGSCQRQLVRLDQHTKLEDIPLHMLYSYNEFLENMLYQYKENRDIALKHVFFHEDMKKINDKYRHWQIVIMPSSIEKIKERGFHHMLTMLEECKLPIQDPFVKLNQRKQSLQTFKERQNIASYMKLKEGIMEYKKPILLVDDVITTGATLKHAYHLLHKHTTKIEALVLCAHPLFVESCDE